jgi:hypothetical protein
MLNSNFTFTYNDVKDKPHLEFLIKEETFRIFNSKNARKGRSAEEISSMVKIGKTAEYYLVELGLYKPAKDIYHDLIDEDDDFVEVKAYDVYDSNAPFVKSELERIRNSAWNKSKWMLLFQYREDTYRFLEKILIRE